MFKPDWAKFRGLNGVETVVNRPLAFPLALGKSWNVNYAENNPNPRFVREIDRHHLQSRSDGGDLDERASAPFKALKIEGKGNWVTG